MACLVDFDGADTVSLGTVTVGVAGTELEYDLRTWRLELTGSMAARMLRDSVVQKHVRQAMVTHPEYDTITVKLRRE
jgi:hypothetical protein